MARSPARRIARVLAFAAGLAALSAPASALAGVTVEPRIVGGQEASPGEYPFMAYVEVRFKNQFGVENGRALCGGALVAARYVVTAGHCVESSPNETPTVADVALGITTVDPAHVLSDPLNTVPAANKFLAGTIIPNPEFAEVGLPVIGAEPTPVNDVAIIRLSRPAAFAQLRLPRPEDAALWAPGVAATAIGFGTTFSGGQVSPRLLEVTLPIAADISCSSIPGYSEYRADTNVCAGGEPGRDTCQGDSGGPLLVPDGTGGFALGGVTSYGLGCGQTFGVYAEDGSAQLNAFLRRVIPQAEIASSSPAPFTGDQVTYTANLADPDGTGPLGGYTTVAWDLDGDGLFTDAVGSATATAVTRAGAHTIGVSATNPTTGDAEVRRVAVVGRTPVLVGFGAATLTVTEGQTAALTVAKPGADGAGTVVATPADPSAVLSSPAPQTATLAAGQTAATVGFATRENRTAEALRTFTVALGGPTGDLRVGTPATVTVTVRDDDAKVTLSGSRRLAVPGTRFAITFKPNRGGKLKAVARAGGRTVATSSTKTLQSTARRRLSLKLTSRGRGLLARRGTLKAKVEVTLTPSGGGVAKTARRTVTLRAT